MNALKLLAGAALLTLGARAQAGTVCVEFTDFCDGFELNISGTSITGEWVNLDCYGSRAPIAGTKLPGPVGRVLCTDDALCPYGSYFDFGYFLDPGTLTFDLFVRDNGGNIEELVTDSAFTWYGGTCGFMQSNAPTSSAGFAAPGMKK